MTVYTNDAALAGQTDGTAATTGNTGGGTNTAFSVIGGTVTFESLHAFDSTQCYKIAAPVGAKGQLQVTIASSANVAARAYFYFSGTVVPTSALQWMTFGGAGQNYIGVDNAGHPFVATSATAQWTSSYVLQANTEYRLEAYYQIATSNATIKYALYIGDSTVAVDSWTTTTANTGSTNPGNVQFGKNSTTGNWCDMYISRIRISNSATDLLGPADNATGLPWTDVTITSWVLSSGTTAYSLLNDASDSTYVTSAATPSAQRLEEKLNPMTAAPGTITVRMNRSADSASGSAVVKLMQGSTEIASWTQATLATTPTDYVFTTSSAQRSSVTDPTDLRVRIDVTAA